MTAADRQQALTKITPQINLSNPPEQGGDRWTQEGANTAALVSHLLGTVAGPLANSASAIRRPGWF